MIVSANEDIKERIKIFEPLEIFRLAEKI